MFEHLSPSEWLLYISEWAENNQQISNIRVTTKVAVNALLHSNPKVESIQIKFELMMPFLNIFVKTRCRNTEQL